MILFNGIDDPVLRQNIFNASNFFEFSKHPQFFYYRENLHLIRKSVFSKRETVNI